VQWDSAALKKIQKCKKPLDVPGVFLKFKIGPPLSHFASSDAAESRQHFAGSGRRAALRPREASEPENSGAGAFCDFGTEFRAPRNSAHATTQVQKAEGGFGQAASAQARQACAGQAGNARATAKF
jgi:hypothetical protein